VPSITDVNLSVSGCALEQSGNLFLTSCVYFYDELSQEPGSWEASFWLNSSTVPAKPSPASLPEGQTVTKSPLKTVKLGESCLMQM
jgi:hypothetical protein